MISSDTSLTLSNMSYYRKKCVVLGCESKDLRLRSFPLAKDKERFLKWLRACGNIELLQLSESQLRHRVVCDRHFEERVKLATTLSRVAVPSLHLPKPIDTSNYKFTGAQTIVAQKTSEQNSTNSEVTKILTELSESDVGGSEDEISEEEHILDAEHDDVEQDAECLSDSSDPGDRATFNYSTEPIYVGRNKVTIWNKTPCTSESATVPSEKDITKPSLRHSVADKEYEIADELSVFREIFDDGMLEEIVACTNFSIEHKHRVCPSYRNMKETTRSEMLAVIGLLYLAGMKKASHASLLELWTDDGTGLEICRSAMSYKRFLFLLDCLQLDDRNTRATRLKTDKLTPVRNIWNMFVENCKDSYSSSESLVVGDKLINFRGKCSFIQQDSNKPTKCGLKIISLVDAKTSFTCNMELYCDQQPEGPYRVSNDPAAIVQRLIEHLKGSNYYNLTCDEHYTSYLLAISLLVDKITFLGAMGRDQREVPSCFLSGKSRPIGSTRLGFRNDATLASHVSQKGKAVIVLSTAHHDAKFNPWTKKPIIIEQYDAAKNAIDIMERTCAIYSVSKKTKRWPLAVFFVLLDVAGVNAQILYNASQTKFLQKYRRGFLKTLALALLKPHLQERANIKTLPLNIQTKILHQDSDEDCQQIDCEQEFPKKRSREIDEENSAKKKDRCFICRQRKAMITTLKCNICSRFTCKRHIAYIKYICKRCDSIETDKSNR